MGPKTVLLVDSHSDSRVVYATMLTHSGFRVLEAGDDEEGLRLARVGGPDLILTELFPWGGGKMLPERLREVPETASIPVIAVTAHIVPAEWEEALKRSCARVLTKPCGPRRILDEVRRLV
ncbi:MAG TPA: response regulator [Longimicrobiaceae bacterium]|nr:response regulator [Longimicrobiaceae bacterium]